MKDLKDFSAAPCHVAALPAADPALGEAAHPTRGHPTAHGALRLGAPQRKRSVEAHFR